MRFVDPAFGWNYQYLVAPATSALLAESRIIGHGFVFLTLQQVDQYVTCSEFVIL